MRDQMNLIHPVAAVKPQTQTNADTAIVGPIIDRKGYESLTLVLIAGTMTDADATAVVTLEHGDDSGLSDTAVPAAADLVGTLALMNFQFDDDIECRKIGYVGSKRYVRATITPTGNNSGAFPVAMVAILGHPVASPTPNPPQ